MSHYTFWAYKWQELAYMLRNITPWVFIWTTQITRYNWRKIKPNIHIVLHDIQKHLINTISFYSTMFIKYYQTPITKGFSSWHIGMIIGLTLTSNLKKTPIPISNFKNRYKNKEELLLTYVIKIHIWQTFCVM